MAVVGRLVTAAGYILLLLSALSRFEVLGDLSFDVFGSVFYSVALILLGRALRKRARANSEQDIVVEALPPPTPPILVDAGAAPPPPRPRATPTPPPSPLPATTEPDPAPVEPPLPMPGPATEHKTSRQLVDEARARWGRKSR